MGWCADYPDANNWLNEVFNSKSGQNYCRFFNEPSSTRWSRSGLSSLIQALREELYEQAEMLLHRR